jgi:enoyl-CoA hydratase/carnithine racemase
VPGLFTYLLAVGKPIVAAVNGPSAGGGFVLAVMSDIRFCSPEGSFTTVFSKRGLISEHGTSWILPRLVGAGQALDMLWSSRKVGAEEALRMGLVKEVVPKEQLLKRAKDYIKDLAEVASPAAMRDTKRLVYRDYGRAYQEALREADKLQWEAIARSDALEGAMSLIERRPANFKRVTKL